MTLKFLISIVILVSLNAFLLYRSKRKRKYGIFPAFISGALALILIAELIYVYYPSYSLKVPELNAHNRNKYYLEIYNAALLDYQKQSEAAQEQINNGHNTLVYLFRLVKIQFALSLGCAVFGILNVSRRNAFYYFCISIYALCFGLFYLFGYWFA